MSDELEGGVASDAGPPTSPAEALTRVLQQWEFQDYPKPQTQKATTYRSDTSTSKDIALAKRLIAMLKVCLNKQVSDQGVARKIRAELESVAAEAPPQRVVKINDLPAKAPVDPAYGDHGEEPAMHPISVLTTRPKRPALGGNRTLSFTRLGPSLVLLLLGCLSLFSLSSKLRNAAWGLVNKGRS